VGVRTWEGVVVLTTVLALLGGSQVRPEAAVAAGSAGAATAPVASGPPGRTHGPGSASSGRAVRPVDGDVIRLFAPPATRFGAGHRGVDLTAPAGTPVHAAMAGTVAFSGRVAGRGWVTVDHGGGLDTTYGWLDPREVSAGAQVRGGQRIGWIAAEASHLDWGARLHGTYVDPLGLLGRWRAHLVAADRSARHR
jgi:murein DD-endopeptidase MepM/ murein hydrolase activator NlpD